MKEEKLFEMIQNIDDDLITMKRPARKYNRLVYVLSAAACICLLISGSILLINRNQTHKVQTWSPSMTAKDYFKYADSAPDNPIDVSSKPDYALPYEESRYFSDLRNALEDRLVIPRLEDHKLFYCVGHYNADGSLYSLEMSWHRRSEGLENYSDLSVTAGYEEVPELTDCIFIEVDANGVILEPQITVTDRNGVQIIAEGRESREKSITFQTENGWYRIKGSFNDTYEDMVVLLDWFFEHPLNLSEFTIESGDNYTTATLQEYPEALAEYLPNADIIAQAGYYIGESILTLKNGDPTAVEVYYCKNPDANSQNSENNDAAMPYGGDPAVSYDGDPAVSLIHWCVNREADPYLRENCTMNLSDLTEDYVLNLLPPDEVTTQVSMDFYLNDAIITIYTNSAKDTWEIIQSIQ